MLDEDELTGLSLSFSSISSISFQTPPPELTSTGSQTLPTDFAMVLRCQSDIGSQTPLYKEKKGRLRLKLSLKCQILENELEQMKERIFYVLFLFYFNAMSASLEKDKQLLNGLPVEIKATNQDPSSLPPAPPVLIIEKDREKNMNFWKE